MSANAYYQELDRCSPEAAEEHRHHHAMPEYHTTAAGLKDASYNATEMNENVSLVQLLLTSVLSDQTKLN